MTGLARLNARRTFGGLTPIFESRGEAANLFHLYIRMEELEYFSVLPTAAWSSWHHG